jgi:hypothetical protein
VIYVRSYVGPWHIAHNHTERAAICGQTTLFTEWPARQKRRPTSLMPCKCAICPECEKRAREESGTDG